MSAARGVSEAVEDVAAIFARVIEVGAIRAVNDVEGRRVWIEGGGGIEKNVGEVGKSLTSSSDAQSVGEKKSIELFSPTFYLKLYASWRFSTVMA